MCSRLEMYFPNVFGCGASFLMRSRLVSCIVQVFDFPISKKRIGAAIRAAGLKKNEDSKPSLDDIFTRLMVNVHCTALVYESIPVERQIPSLCGCR